jgi:predicted nucleic acid-binding protein
VKVLFDSSVLLPALVEGHRNHRAALAALQDAKEGRVRGFATAHALAETWGSTTALPLKPPLTGEEVLRSLREILLDTIEVVPLGEEDYLAALESAAGLGLRSGAIYDGLHAQAARRIGAEAILTFNLKDFRRIAPDLRDRIRKP